MAERKFGALATIRQQKEHLAEVPDALPPSSTLPPKPPKPLGKRSDPAFKQYSVLLKKDDHARALEWLRQSGTGHDFADLMQSLLENHLRSLPR